jgi:hypothetical protein
VGSGNLTKGVVKMTTDLEETRQRIRGFVQKEIRWEEEWHAKARQLEMSVRIPVRVSQDHLLAAFVELDARMEIAESYEELDEFFWDFDNLMRESGIVDCKEKMKSPDPDVAREAKEALVELETMWITRDVAVPH